MSTDDRKLHITRSDNDNSTNTYIIDQGTRTSFPLIEVSPTPGETHVSSDNIVYSTEPWKLPMDTVCMIDSAPWPVVIISIIGAVMTIYAGIAPNIDTNRRIFGIIILLLWTIIWDLILWIIWRECHRYLSWWLLLIPVTGMILFFVLIITMNVGASM